MKKVLIGYFLLIIFLVACQVGDQGTQTDLAVQNVQKTVRTSVITRTPKPTNTLVPSRTPSPSRTPTASPTPFPLPVGLIDHINRLAQKAIANGPLVGLSLGLQLDQGEPLTTAIGLANQKDKIEARVETIYPIGSISDQITAAAVLQLAEKSVLSLDDPINKYFPEVPPGAQAIQIKHLLSYTSGLPPVARLGIKPNEYQNSTALAKAYLGEITELDSPPGEKTVSNPEGYFFLRQIIEIVSEQFYLDYIKENLIDPAGMKHTVACKDIPQSANQNLASAYNATSGQPEQQRLTDGELAIDGESLCSSVEDLLNWQASLVHARLLEPATYKTMTTPFRLNNGETGKFGYGLQVGGMGQRQVGYTLNYTDGNSGLIVRLPRLGASLVLLSNTAPANKDILVNLATEIIRQAFPRDP